MNKDTKVLLALSALRKLIAPLFQDEYDSDCAIIVHDGRMELVDSYGDVISKIYVEMDNPAHIHEWTIDESTYKRLVMLTQFWPEQPFCLIFEGNTPTLNQIQL